MAASKECLEKAIQALVERDVGFHCTHADHSGQRSIHLTPEELLTYAEDPVAFLSRKYGVTKLQYLAWHQSNYSVVCAGTKGNGKPCKQIVSGGSRVEPAQWALMQGQYCHVHS